MTIQKIAADRAAREAAERIEFVPLDVNDWCTHVTMRDGTEHIVVRAPGSTYAEIAAAKNAGNPTVTLEVIVEPQFGDRGQVMGDRARIEINPAQVIRIT
jgi:hypothetical protein